MTSKPFADKCNLNIIPLSRLNEFAAIGQSLIKGINGEHVTTLLDRAAQKHNYQLINLPPDYNHPIIFQSNHNTIYSSLPNILETLYKNWYHNGIKIIWFFNIFLTNLIQIQIL